MVKKKKLKKPVEIPPPQERPLLNPDKIPEVPQIPGETPDNNLGENSFKTPPGEVPPPDERA
jgi:hypothetical protein